MATESEDSAHMSEEEREAILRLIWERDYEAHEAIYDELARE